MSCPTGNTFDMVGFSKYYSNNMFMKVNTKVGIYNQYYIDKQPSLPSLKTGHKFDIFDNVKP